MILIFIFFILFYNQCGNAALVNCHPEPGSNQADCSTRGCTWDSNNDTLNTPQCYYPSNTGYIVQNAAANNLTLAKSTKSVANPFGADFTNLNFAYQEIGSGIYVSISPGPRYQPPVPINRSPTISSSEKLQLSYKNDSIFSFSVTRARNNVPIWDTSIGAMLFADQFIQVATNLPTDKIYGFGENQHPSLKHNFTSYTTWGFFARDQPPPKGFTTNNRTENLYGVHPFYLGLESDGTAHGVLIFNSNAQEIVTGPGPSLTYRTIGGMLELFFFPGPRPEDVIQQYQQVIGTPFLPAYWNLGYQLSREGYVNFTRFATVVNRTLANKIPIDVVFADRGDYMDDGQGFTINQGWLPLINFTNWLHTLNIKLTLNNEPYVAADSPFFQRGLQQNAAFYEWPNMNMVPTSINNQYPMTNGTKFMLGNVWPHKHVLWGDFTDNVTREWYASEWNISFDAIWLDMNEPSVFETAPYGSDNSTYLHCPLEGNLTNWVYKYDNPPYWTVNAYNYGGKEKYLFSKTLCLCGQSSRDGVQIYNTKNLMGWGETIAAKKGIEVATGQRSAVISRANFVSNGHYGGHWTGDTYSTWESLQSTVIVIQEFNLFGMPYVGSDICGFQLNTTENLCLRWHQAGAFHSFMRNHNVAPQDQDPSVWPSVTAAAIKSNLFRYRHLPYLFSLHFYASLYGGTIQRPVFFEFPNDSQTYELSYQFLWGPALMVMPVVYENATSVTGYLPTSEIWYSLYDYFYGTKVSLGIQTFTAPTNYLIPVFVRGGYVLPRQRPGLTTTAGRENEFQLLVAIDAKFHSSGELYYDDGVSIISTAGLSQHNYYHFLFDFTVNTTMATLNIIQARAATNQTLKTLDQLEILGYPYTPNLNSAQLNGKPITINTLTSSYSPFTQILNITTTGLIDWNVGSSWILTWNNNNNL